MNNEQNPTTPSPEFLALEVARLESVNSTLSDQLRNALLSHQATANEYGTLKDSLLALLMPLVGDDFVIVSRETMRTIADRVADAKMSVENANSYASEAMAKAEQAQAEASEAYDEASNAQDMAIEAESAISDATDALEALGFFA
jgi:hypothetical protein